MRRYVQKDSKILKFNLVQGTNTLTYPSNLKKPVENPMRAFVAQKLKGFFGTSFGTSFGTLVQYQDDPQGKKTI